MQVGCVFFRHMDRSFTGLRTHPVFGDILTAPCFSEAFAERVRMMHGCRHHNTFLGAIRLLAGLVEEDREYETFLGQLPDTEKMLLSEPLQQLLSANGGSWSADAFARWAVTMDRHINLLTHRAMSFERTATSL
jgi:hypothetical protein